MLDYQLRALTPLGQGDAATPFPLSEAVACYVESRKGHGLRPKSFDQIKLHLLHLISKGWAGGGFRNHVPIQPIMDSGSWNFLRKRAG